MNQSEYKKGFGILAIIVVLAIVAVAGGGAYYSSKKAEVKTETKVETETETKATTSASVGAQSGTLRGLLALGKDTTCTFSGAEKTSSYSGTVYISGAMMRGDFNMKSGTSAAIDSHMIKNGDDMYTWSGSQGAKMNISAMTKASAQADNSNQVGLDQKVNYNCSDWNKDVTKFTVPASVNFIDISAMLNTQLKMGGVAH